MKRGYKQTEVGVIPRDWLNPQLQQVTRDDSPICYGIVQVGPYSPNGVPVLAIKNLNLDYSSNLHRASAAVERPYSRSRIRPNDIVISVKGTTGRVGMVPAHFQGNISRDLARIRPRAEIAPRFIYQMLQSELVQGRLAKAAVGTTRMELSIAILKQVRIPLPPTKAEQEAIAEALSDSDALIESLERLLSKKRNLRRGAMQELLTGKKRVLGFSRDWGHVRLRDLLSYERPDNYIVKDTEYSERGDIPVLTANQSFVLGYTAESFGVCTDLPVIVFDDFTVASKYVDFPFKVKSSAIKLLRPKHFQVDLRFVFARMQVMRFPLGDHKRYYISEFQNLEVAVPDHPEQQAVAAILGDMDAEIAALEARLTKARQLKQGTMQELLTGRIRLV